MNRSKQAARGGYTLSEMLVVLGVMVVVAALAQPALRSALHDSRLRSASRQVSAALAKTRLKAMQSGVAHRFRYQVGKSRFEVAPASLPTDGEQDGAPPVNSRDGQPSTAQNTELAGHTQAAPAPRAVEQDLPEGVSFEPVEEHRTAAVDEAGWSQPIVFHPNGRTNNAQIRLRGQRNAVVNVSLRGLTGVATAGKPRHDEELR